MNAVDDLGGSDHPARRLCDALEPAVSGRARAREIAFARRTAQAAELPGLDHLLAALEPHAGRPWPREVEPALERVRRLCARARDAGTLDGFRESDRELEGLAGELAAFEWNAGRPAAGAAPRATVPTLTAAVTLHDLPLDEGSAAIAARVRLAPPVAAALRAAIDWIRDAADERPLALTTGDSFLEVTAESVDPGGVPAATVVLAAVQANLSPHGERGAEESGSPWRIRVPTYAERACYLMVVQEGVRLAIPWHAVLRLVMGDRLAASSPDARAPRLGAARGDERTPRKPLVLIAHGRTRAWLAADRMVWRLPAEAVDAPGLSPWPGIRDAVRTDDGETWWVAEPGWLLSTVEPPPAPAARARNRRTPNAAPAKESGTGAPARPGAPSPDPASIAVRPDVPAPALEPRPDAAADIEAATRGAEEEPSRVRPGESGRSPGTRTEPLEESIQTGRERIEREAAGDAQTAIEIDDDLPELEEADVEPLAAEPTRAPVAENPRGRGPQALPWSVPPRLDPPAEPAPHPESRPRARPAAVRSEAPPATLRTGPTASKTRSEPPAFTPRSEPAPSTPRTDPTASTTRSEPPASTTRREPTASTTPSEPSASPPRSQPPSTSRSQPGPSAPGRMPRRRTALVAEDSLTARIFLTRLLEQQGFQVRAVDSAAALRGALAEPWGVVFLDVELPDGRGTGFLRELSSVATGATWIAMIRDDDDGRLAREAGFERTLRKPVERDALERLLVRVGFGRGA